MRFYTNVHIGPNRELTPAGFTLFKNVSISRTGVMEYGPRETDIDPGPDGLVHITRTPEEVFKAESLASFNGAPFTIGHPSEDVTPDNWSQYANGFFVDVRRGTGDQADEVVGDLLVTTAYALAEIDSGTSEVSAGYDADYRKTGEGRGEQINIIGNHVALVGEGRCGSRCAITDQRFQQEEGAAIDDEALELTPTQHFVEAVQRIRDRRNQASTSDAATVDTRNMTPTQQFVAASKRLRDRR
jgi:hypothetical protein